MSNEFKEYWNKNANYCRVPPENEDTLKRVVEDAFEMGIAIGMDIITERIKKLGGLDKKTEEELLEKLDS